MREARRIANDRPERIILDNAKDFLNAGLSLLFKPRLTSREAKLAIVSIQTAVELLAKYRLVKESGLAAIVKGGQVPKGHLLQAAQAGHFQTIGYSDCLKLIRTREYISAIDKEVIGRFQALRNALVHFAAEINIEDVRINAAWALIRVLSMFAAGEDRDNGEMQTHRSFLDEENFNLLINFPPYRHESIDAASDSLDSEDIFRCWECGNDSLTLRPSETYYCHCCGLTVVSDAAAFTDCPLCNEPRAVCYDPLNSENGLHHGRCLSCLTFVKV